MGTCQRLSTLMVTLLVSACAASSGSGDADEVEGCTRDCRPCDADYVRSDCSFDCVCSVPNDPYQADYEALAACEAVEPCPESWVRGNMYGFTWTGGDCLLSHLRDRAPGRYLASYGFGEGGGGQSDYILLLNGSDEVTVLDVEWAFGTLNLGNSTLSYAASRRCTLKAAEQFEACLTAGTELNGFQFPTDEMCEQLMDWVEACEPVSNTECPLS